jgi:DNA-binding CsgD family transcriptional regulator
MRSGIATSRSSRDDDPFVQRAAASPSAVGAALRSIARELDVFDISTPRILPRMLPRIAGALGLERMLAYGLRREGRGWCFSFVESYNLVAHDVRAEIASLDAILREAAELPLFDPANPDPAQRNTVRVLPPLRALVADGLGEWGPPETRPARTTLGARLLTAMEPWHIADAHCVRVLLCDGAELLGWIGGYHPAPISPVTVARFRRLVPSLQRRLRAERILGVRVGPVDGIIAATLKHVAKPAYVTDLRGNLLATNDPGRARFTRNPETTHALLQRPQTVAGAPRITVHEVNDHATTGMRLVVIEEEAAAPPAPPVHAFGQKHGLTARQIEVLSHLVTGASNVNIALALGCAERTVETHLAAIFKRLGCMSRVELVGQVLLTEREPITNVSNCVAEENQTYILYITHALLRSRSLIIKNFSARETPPRHPLMWWHERQRNHTKTQPSIARILDTDNA